MMDVPCRKKETLTFFRRRDLSCGVKSKKKGMYEQRRCSSESSHLSLRDSDRNTSTFEGETVFTSYSKVVVDRDYSRARR